LFLAFGALYFLASWIPKLAESTGLSRELAIYAGTVFNGGAFFGILLQGYLSTRFGLKRTIGTLFLLTAILMAVFGVFIGSDAYREVSLGFTPLPLAYTQLPSEPQESAGPLVSAASEEWLAPLSEVYSLGWGYRWQQTF